MNYSNILALLIIIIGFTVLTIVVLIQERSKNEERRPEQNKAIGRVHIGRRYKSEAEINWVHLSEKEKRRYQQECGNPPDWCKS